jgi:general stress protein YciG
MAKSPKQYAQEFARKGGNARAKALTPEQRKEIARKAAQARWAKKRGEK